MDSVSILPRFGCCLLCIGLTASLMADDWPQFGGSHRDGRSEESGLLQQWPDEGPPLVWRVDHVGTGYSSVAVVADRIYTLGDEGDEQYVIALDSHDGRLIWKTRIGPANAKPSYAGSRSTPTVDQDRLYAFSTDGDIVCLNLADGALIWAQNLKQDFDAQIMLAMGRMDWQLSESPLVDGDRVVVTPGTSAAALVAFHKADGRVLWQTDLPFLGEEGADGAAYSSMVAGTIQGTRQYVQLLGRGVVGVDAATGEFLWGYNRIANGIANISSPLIVGDRVFVSTGYQTGAALLEIEHDQGDWTAHEQYFLSSQTFQNHHGGMIHHDGHIFAGHGHKQGMPVCIELASGQLTWGPIRNDGQGSASVCYADQHIYFRYEDGLVVLIEANPQAYQEKGSFTLPEVRGKSWSRPAVANGKLYLKEQELLYCYDISTP